MGNPKFAFHITLSCSCQGPERKLASAFYGMRKPTPYLRERSPVGRQEVKETRQVLTSSVLIVLNQACGITEGIQNPTEGETQGKAKDG